jgi:hypothetical protein
MPYSIREKRLFEGYRSVPNGSENVKRRQGVQRIDRFECPSKGLVEDVTDPCTTASKGNLRFSIYPHASLSNTNNSDTSIFFAVPSIVAQ